MPQEGPFQLKGDLYLVDRKVVSGGSVTSPPDYTGGVKVARLKEVLRWRWITDVQLHAKHGNSPSGSRITGDYIEIEATFTELTKEFMKLASNKRASGTTFAAKTGNNYKLGHLLRADDYNAIVIRHTPAPTEKPLLYIPYCVCIEQEWFAARAARHVEYCQLTLASVDFDGEDAAGYENPVFEYGELSEFPLYAGGGS